jgi:predicted dehydrogenase
MLVTRRKARVAVVGLGYWGANVARNLGAVEGCELRWCCDLDADRAARAAARFGAARSSDELDELLADEELDAIAIATPVPTHAAIAARVLEAGKDCFVEKPMAGSGAEARRLAGLAERGERVLMIGHLLEYHPGLEALATLVGGGELGEVRYIYSQRLNLGRLRADENALWSLGAHDVSMILALTGERPVEVSARGESFVRDGVEDVVFGLLRFPSGVVAHMHLSWLDPHKERRLTVVGSQRMASFDDMAAERKLTVFDKGFDPDEGSVDDYVARSGEARNPPIGGEEPLRAEMSHFVDCVRERRRPRTDAASGIRVVEVLEALQSSLEENGAAVRLAEGAAR